MSCQLAEKKKQLEKKRHEISIAGPDRLINILNKVGVSAPGVQRHAVYLRCTAVLDRLYYKKKETIQASSSVILVDIHGTFKNQS